MAAVPSDEHFLDAALRAAHAAGRVLRRYFTKAYRIEYKSDINLITEADREAEAVILRTLRHDFPDHAYLAEESGHPGDGSRSPYRWIIDPLDGTTNFAHSFPVFCVSIALEADGEILLGVVYDPVHKELFVGRKGRGATLNNRPVRVSGIERLNRALLVTGFAYNLRQVPENNLDHFSAFTLRTQGVRRTGSAALDLCYVACGRFDGFWELYLSPWDTAAGMRIALEAGAVVTDFSNRPFRIESKEIVASNGKIHGEMIEVLGKKGRGEWKKRE
jgi:myo-inositol-1(or 4)-monophosphatase